MWMLDMKLWACDGSESVKNKERNFIRDLTSRQFVRPIADVPDGRGLKFLP